MEFITFFSLVSVLVIGLLLWSNRAGKPIEGMPQFGTRIPWLGHVIAYGRVKDHAHDTVTALLNKHKTHICITFPQGIVAVYLYPDENIVRHIMKDKFENYIIPRMRISMGKELFGNGIFTANGDNWRKQRKAASHIFNLGRLRTNMTDVFIDHGHTLLSVLQDFKGGEFDAQELFLKYTLDSFAKLAFGEDVNSLTQGNSPLATAYDRAQMLLVPRVWDFFWKVKRALNLGREAELKVIFAQLTKYTNEIIAKRRKEMAQGMVRGDLIFEFLRAAKAEGEELSDDDLRDILLNFLVAGRDTTATALTWFMYEMTQRPDVQAKVAEECRTALNGDPKNATYEIIESLAYTRGALLESIRLHPPVPSDSKEAVEDDTLPDGTFIPKGTLVNFHPYSSGRSPDLWEEPLKFSPERWEEKHSEFKFPHFNAGLRVCLGKTLALLEAKTAIAMLMCNNQFRLAEGRPPVAYQLNITLTVKGGLWVNAAPRTN